MQYQPLVMAKKKKDELSGKYGTFNLIGKKTEGKVKKKTVNKADPFSEIHSVRLFPLADFKK